MRLKGKSASSFCGLIFCLAHVCPYVSLLGAVSWSKVRILFLM